MKLRGCRKYSQVKLGSKKPLRRCAFSINRPWALPQPGSGTVSALAEKVLSTIRHPELVEGSAPRALARYQPSSDGESHRKLILRQAQDDGIMKVRFLWSFKLYHYP